MKNKIIYAASFVLAFVMVSGLVIYLNSIYENIFKFDFAPTQQVISTQVRKDSTQVTANNIKTPATKNVVKDSVKQNNQTQIKDSTKLVLKDTSGTTKQNVVSETKNRTDVTPQTAEQVQSSTAVLMERIAAKNDSVYKSSIKSLVKLYESMDTRKAAKIIQGYSDNIARDLLLKMKKKKAAEIIAEFKPEVAIRIISVNR